jgi:LacI family transcriptional regulator
VPDDLSVVGYNDIEVAHYVGLTTVRVPMRAMGRVGTELLLRGLEDRLERRPEHARLGVELVARRTSGAVRPG